MDAEEWMREQIRRRDEAKLDQRVARALRTKVHQIIPHEWFSVASSECRDTFTEGYFTSCVGVAQAVAEGLAKFLLKKNSLKAGDDQKVRVDRLRRAGLITDQCHRAFLRIRGTDRNSFHHLNEDIPTDWAKLESRAEECVSAPFEIESEIFAYTPTDKGLEIAQPKYWTKPNSQAVGPVQLRGY